MYFRFKWFPKFIVIGLVTAFLTGCAFSVSSKSANEKQMTSAPQGSASSVTPQPLLESRNKESVDPATDLTVTPKAIYLTSGASQPLIVSVVIKGQPTDISGDTDITYRSSDDQIVIVNHEGVVSAANPASAGQTATVEVSYHGLQTEVQLYILASLEASVKLMPDQSLVVTNPLDVQVLVNKQRSLAADFIPSDLVEVNIPFSFKGQSDRKMMRKEAAQALENLIAAAAQEGIRLFGISGYRSYQTQVSVYNNNVKTQGEAEASRVSARPGHSEHQTGLAMDLSSASNQYALTTSFANTPEGKWLAQHASTFGFIIRYPRDKENLTGYSFEPWHIRYVGNPLAEEISNHQLTFEQFYEKAQAVIQQTN